jgi:putative membrane protein
MRRALFGFLQGLIIGAGAILPGISGASLAVVFGLYGEFLELVAHPLKKVIPFVKTRHALIFGIACGFAAFTLLVDRAFSNHQGALVVLFAGFIAGTLPGIYSGAKKSGIGKGEIIAFFACALAILSVKFAGGGERAVLPTEPAFPVWVLCGSIIGAGSLLPGLSASFLLIPIGLYGPLLDAVVDLKLGVGVALGVGVLASFALLSRAIELLYRRFDGIMNFAVLGLTVGSLVIAFPRFAANGQGPLAIARAIGLRAVLLGAGFTASYALSLRRPD